MGKVRSFLERMDSVADKMTRREENLYQNLNEQIDKIFKTNKRQSRSGKERFKAGCQDFAKHLAKEFGSQNFKNIRDQHLISYVEASRERGLSKSAITTNLSAIRKMHELMPKKKHELMIQNKDLNIPQTERNQTNTDRAWTNEEYQQALELAQHMGRDDVTDALQLGRYFGMRIEEATALHTQQLQRALKSGFVELHNTKNGIERDVPIETNDQRVILQNMLGQHEKGRLFIKHNRNHAQAKRRIQDWLKNNRAKFQQDQQFNKNDQRDKSDLTFHGLRHSYTRSNYYENLNQGMNKQESRRDVSRNLGHGRDTVTHTYL